MLRRIAAVLFSVCAGAATIEPGSAQSVVAVPIHTFTFAGSPEAALARLRAAVAKCWSDDYDSRALGPYREVAEIPPNAAAGATVRLEWRRVVNDKPAGLLKRAFDIALAPEGGATRVTVLAYGPNREAGRDIEGWLNGSERCFAGRYPSP